MSAIAAPRAESWVKVRPGGLWIEPGGFFIDPTRPASRAVITHGHGDHARPGNGHVLATPETIEIMKARYGETAGESLQSLPYGQELMINDVKLRFVPAGHVLGSAQIVLDWRGSRVVVSGDYKRSFDPTCPAFEPVEADVFITEATFGLPIFRHPDPEREIAKLLHSVSLYPERAHVIGAYALGKTQRVIALLRRAGWDRPIWLHGALQPLCELYERLGVKLGELRPATAAKKNEMAGEIVLAPPSEISERWSRRLPDPVACVASGWMQVRQRAKQRGVELPLVISDHADWDELCRTLHEVVRGEVWVTHGREDALLRMAELEGLPARALRLVGFEDDEA